MSLRDAQRQSIDARRSLLKDTAGVILLKDRRRNQSHLIFYFHVMGTKHRLYLLKNQWINMMCQTSGIFYWGG